MGFKCPRTPLPLLLKIVAYLMRTFNLKIKIEAPVGWVERIPTKKSHIAQSFQVTEKLEITKNRVKPNAL